MNRLGPRTQGDRDCDAEGVTLAVGQNVTEATSAKLGVTVEPATQTARVNATAAMFTLRICRHMHSNNRSCGRSQAKKCEKEKKARALAFFFPAENKNTSGQAEYVTQKLTQNYVCARFCAP